MNRGKYGQNWSFIFCPFYNWIIVSDYRDKKSKLRKLPDHVISSLKWIFDRFLSDESQDQSRSRATLCLFEKELFNSSLEFVCNRVQKILEHFKVFNVVNFKRSRVLVTSEVGVVIVFVHTVIVDVAVVVYWKILNRRAGKQRNVFFFSNLF